MSRVVQPCGTDSAYTRHKRNGEEPCRECVAAHNQYCVAARARRSEFIDPDDEGHGSLSFYANWGCRCPDCKAANAAYFRDYRRRVAS